MGSPPTTTLPSRPFIYVLAGVTGARKTSVVGARIKDMGLNRFNPSRPDRREVASQPSWFWADFR